MSTYDKNNPETIQAMFGSIAKSYDRTNAVLSFQLHKRWNAELVHRTIEKEKSNVMLDLCCGTGEIAYTHLQSSRKKHTVYMLDFCEEMLQHAKEKADKRNFSCAHDISYLKADAQIIPLPSSSIDAVTIAYGIRNVKSPVACIQEVFRVLRPGGTFGILELTQPNNAFLRLSHTLYLRTLLPILGWCFTSNQQAYQYLRQSIAHFIRPKEVEQLLIQANFQQTYCQPLAGGIATIIFGKKPV